MFDFRKYPNFGKIDIVSRTWPDQVIDSAPIWCSVDLRDGNQALIEPMNVDQKKTLFQLLVEVGFLEIEVGFPSASQPDFDFVRALIEENLIPNHVTIQVLTQARDELIERTFESLRGVKKAIVHVYNSTSIVQRERVFCMSKQEIKQIAINGAESVKRHAERYPETEWTFEYSPESFTGTEVNYAVEVCNAVINVWGSHKERKCIINLPATVEMATPNIFADQVELFLRDINDRDSIILSLHTHNDRGCAVAAAELGYMAGADRIEGTLLGNGERTGNMDIVTMAMNLYSQGIDPQLDFSQMSKVIKIVEECTNIPLHPRHPYAGELVFTAFSGSHQDAIKKSLAKYQEGNKWEVAYLPIDPRDLGRSYQEIIRINSQSGKGGIAYILEIEFGLLVPRWLQIDFSSRIQGLAEKYEGEVPTEEIYSEFEKTYMNPSSEFKIEELKIEKGRQLETVEISLFFQGESITFSESGKGLLNCICNGLSKKVGQPVEIINYSEHALSSGSDSKAIAYILVNILGNDFIGAYINDDFTISGIGALLNAINYGLIKLNLTKVNELA